MSILQSKITNECTFTRLKFEYQILYKLQLDKLIIFITFISY